MKQSYEDDGRRTDILHPSEMAKADWCHRASYYRLAGHAPPKDDVNRFAMENIFEEGNFIHAKWQNWLREMGRLYGVWTCLLCKTRWEGLASDLPECDGCGESLWKYSEVPLSGESQGYPVAGHSDGAVPDINVMIELKSIGNGTLRIEEPELLKQYRRDDGSYDLDGLWKSLRRPLPSHIRQGNIYLWLAKLCGYSWDTMVFIYELKANQQVKEFKVKLSDAVMEPLVDRIQEVVYALDVGEPPACIYGGCKQCRAWESVGGEEEANQGSNPGGRAQKSRGQAQGRDARSVSTRPARRRDTRATRGSDGPARQRSDDSVPGVDGVDELRGSPAGNGSGRRTVRRKYTRKA